MMPIFFEFVFSVMIIFFGLFWVLRPQILAMKRVYFFKDYPLARYASDYQVTSKQLLLSVLGVLFIFAGTYGVICNLYPI